MGEDVNTPQVYLVEDPLDANSPLVDTLILPSDAKDLKWYMGIDPSPDEENSYDELELWWDSNCLSGRLDSGRFQLVRGWDENGEILVDDMTNISFYKILYEDAIGTKDGGIFFTILRSQKETDEKEATPVCLTPGVSPCFYIYPYPNPYSNWIFAPYYHQFLNYWPFEQLSYPNWNWIKMGYWRQYQYSFPLLGYTLMHMGIFKPYDYLLYPYLARNQNDFFINNRYQYNTSLKDYLKKWNIF